MADQDLIIRDTKHAAQALPSNIEAEAAFLGAVLFDNRVLEELPVNLQPGHFFESIHAKIFERILQLIDRNATASPVSLKPYFEGDEALADLGGTNYLMQLSGTGLGTLAARELAQQIYDLALLRELVVVGRDLVTGAMDTSEDISPETQIENAEAQLYRVAEGSATNESAKSFYQATKVSLGQIQRALNSGGKTSGKTTGLTSINTQIGGLQNSDLIIVAGRPGMGKSSLAMNIAFNTSEKLWSDRNTGIEDKDSIGAAVAVFSLEMSADQLATRIISEQTGVTAEDLRRGKISREEFAKLAHTSQRLAELPLYIDDSPALTVAGLRARARRLKRRHDIGLIVIDYLQLMQGSSRNSDNRVNEISEISRGLKTLAKELDVPVMALSQLSRAVEQREDKRPILSDLRESGSIEQDADMVWFIYREDYYEANREPDPSKEQEYQDWRERMEKAHGIAELIFAKNRHGSTGKIRLRFEHKITKFSDLAHEDYGSPDY